MSWGTVIAAGATLVGSAVSSKSAKDAGKKASKGSAAELDFIKEQADRADAYQRPYRQAGYTALNALMSMTGLSGGGGGATYDEDGWPIENTGGGILGTARDAATQPRTIPDRAAIMGGGGRESGYVQRYSGAPMYPDTIYNINELGAEDVYQGGAITRNSNPQTIEGEGYVHPNIEGRNYGGNYPNIESRFLGGLILKNDPLTKGAFEGGKKKRSKRISALEDQVAGLQSNQQPAADPDTTAGSDYNFQTDPGYRFRFEEGQRALDRGAAARGGLLSGGYARKAIRYGQGFASNEYTNVYNRIANIAGLGQTANQSSGNYALQAGLAGGRALSEGGVSRAQGQYASGQAWASGITDLAGSIDWGGVFNRGGSATRPTHDFSGRPIQYS